MEEMGDGAHDVIDDAVEDAMLQRVSTILWYNIMIMIYHAQMYHDIS